MPDEIDCANSTPYLLNEDGRPFTATKLAAISQRLDALSTEERLKYRDANASAIANHPAMKMLVVSGPGTGKSHLFLNRIGVWLNAYAGETILVTSFVRKLVTDLETDIENSKLLETKGKQVTASTLHKLARSFVEKNHGSSLHRFRPYFKIIGSWKTLVWEDVLAFHSELDPSTYTLTELERQFHDDSYSDDAGWKTLVSTYYQLSRFYNAAGFSDLIVAARVALEENESLNTNSLFIIDEYQDFNEAEEKLLLQLSKSAKGILIVGDDDQVLYDKLKSGKPDLIRRLYTDRDFAKAMLPFCARSSFHITKTAQFFISQERDTASIEKIYLPLQNDPSTPKVRIVGCAAPATAIGYIERFVQEHMSEIEQRKQDLGTGNKKDAFLLILTPAGKVKFFRPNQEKLFRLVDQYKTKVSAYSEDYYRTINYYSLAKNSQDNFVFRKVLYYEGISSKKVHKYLLRTLKDQRDLRELEELGDIVVKCAKVQEILDSGVMPDEKVRQLTGNGIRVDDPATLSKELAKNKSTEEEVAELEHEEEAELAEKEISRMSAIELLTIVSSKGLSADHVMIIGCDDVNMGWVSKNAFYVALTRARHSLHIVTSLKSAGSTSVHAFTNWLANAHTDFCWYKKGDGSLKSFKDKDGFVSYLNWFQKTFYSQKKPKAKAI